MMQMMKTQMNLTLDFKCKEISHFSRVQMQNNSMWHSAGLPDTGLIENVRVKRFRYARVCITKISNMFSTIGREHWPCFKLFCM